MPSRTQTGLETLVARLAKIDDTQSGERATREIAVNPVIGALAGTRSVLTTSPASTRFEAGGWTTPFELRALGFEVSARTVSRYRRQALRRPPSQSWRTFLRNHASSIWAADLFTVQTLAFRTLSVLIVIDHDRRRIRHWNVTEHPNAPWIWQQMIEATAWGQQPGFLIRDRDRSYGGDFIARARRLGIETILTPVHAPNANAIAERVIGTLRRECRDHVIAVNEQHLRRVLGEYVQHYNAMRPHRSLSLDSPEGRSPVQRTPSQRVVSKPVLGGLHHEYRWAA